jgi:hypothetical protein
MTDDDTRFTGGCLCGALRYEVRGEPLYMGHCYCRDCRKASGSGFIPFMGVAAQAVRFQGESKAFVSPSANGGDATRNFCPLCAGLVFGGVRGESDSFTLYVGSLDDPSLFRPTVAIFAKDRPDWTPMPSGLVVFDAMPPAG